MLHASARVLPDFQGRNLHAAIHSPVFSPDSVTHGVAVGRELTQPVPQPALTKRDILLRKLATYVYNSDPIGSVNAEDMPKGPNIINKVHTYTGSRPCACHVTWRGPCQAVSNFSLESGTRSVHHMFISSLGSCKPQRLKNVKSFKKVSRCVAEKPGAHPSRRK